MPTYLFKNKDTGEVFEKWMKIAECDEYLESNPNLEKLPQAGYYGGVQDLKHKHVDDGWKETLSKISESKVINGAAKRNLSGWM